MNKELHILLVEDNPGDAMLIEEILLEKADFHFKINVAETLKAATTKIKSNTFDIILLDLGLPDSDGLMGLEQIIAHEKNAPIIVITGLSDEDMGRKAIHMGAQNYIIKGGTESKGLVEAIYYAVERNEHLRKIKLREAELEELIAQKDRLISIISHDVRGPIGTVLNFLKLLKEKFDILEDRAKQNHIEKCFTATQSTYNLIETLLEWAHTQSGRREVVPKTINCRNLIAGSIKPLLEIANKKDIRIVDLTPDDINLFVDPEMISTVVRNLVSNAIKFSHHESLIRIEHGENKNQDLAHLQVIDTGVGIEKDQLNKILDIGEGYTSSGTDNEKGTGFGLILCKELVEKNGGTLWIESQENKGTTINFTVPFTK